MTQLICVGKIKGGKLVYVRGQLSRTSLTYCVETQRSSQEIEASVAVRKEEKSV
jgi:hypothetical protein